ncbi:MAG: sigma-E factor negative regulatory protein [Candidatus Igneacidithiobacillus chanchocoensis]
MNDETKSALMAFMDGELSTLSARRMASRLEQETALRDAWEAQYRVSFLLHARGMGGVLASPDFADRVQQAIAAELPALPRGRRVAHWWGWSSVAAVSLLSVSLLVFTPWQDGASTGTKELGVAPAAALNQPVAEHFHLRPVRFATSSGPLLHADVTIQRDIQRIWRPAPERYLPGSSAQVAGFSSASAGLLPVSYRSQEGIYAGLDAAYHH